METNSDLLVMGAYSRSRLRQRIFGGVTEYMLTRASIPVLMLQT
ncbi:MAG: universal stress protein [Gammaproteobacteria bacterium]